ncbi:cytochrome P450 [Actinocorallia populi]|uniref:cytochrome P450 n=1 Tax=Actinocorallia populi TaxID=2079200 RepID=UPI001E4C8BC4|nr:cytochrome P450 [Actinocorallia populi]
MLARDPYEGLCRVQSEYGNIAGFGWGPVKYVLMFGPEANAFLFANSGLFTVREAFDVLVPVNGETALIASDGEAHKHRRRLVQPAFHRRRVDGYIARMAENADALLDTWRPGETVDAYAALREVTRRTTVQLLFGDRLAADEELLGGELQTLLDGIDRPYSQLVALRSVPNPFWRRVIQARASVLERLMREIADRRMDPTPRQDVLGLLLDSRDADGGGLTDVELQDQAISLMAAGYETTSAALGWAVHLMLTTEGVWERAREEVGDVPLTAEALQSFTYLGRVVDEVLRLFPPAVMSARKVAEDFVFEGHRVPAGSMLLYSPYVTHRMESVWPEAEAFRPDRWDPASPLHRPATPATYLPFGGGQHRCIGSAMAVTGIKVSLARLLARTGLEHTGAPVTPRSITAMRPRDGVPVVVKEVRAA